MVAGMLIGTVERPRGREASKFYTGCLYLIEATFIKQYSMKYRYDNLVRCKCQ